MIGAAAVAVGALFAYGYFRWSRRRMYELAREVPDFAPALPFIGHAHHFTGDDEEAFNFMVQFAEAANRNQGIVKLWIAHKLFYVVTDPEDVCTALGECLNKSYIFNFFTLLGNGLVSSCASVWKFRIKKLLPSFNQKVLNGFVPIFDEQSSIMAKRMGRNAGGDWFSPVHYIGAATLENVCRLPPTLETTMSTPMGTQDVPESPYLVAVTILMEMASKRILKIWLYSDFLYRLFGYQKKELDAVETAKNVATKVIQDRKTYIEKNCINEMELGNRKGEPGLHFMPFLDLILKLNRDGVFTDEMVRDEVNTMVVAGQETTAYTVHYALLLLGSHQDKQQKVYEEIRSIFGSDDVTVTKEALAKLVYLEAVVNETLRLYPIVIALFRSVDKEVKLKNCTLAKGSDVMVVTWGCHRHQRWGKDYNSFRPERWFDPDCAAKTPGAFCPFGAGKRTCLGKNYAMMSMKTMLVHVLKDYRVYSDISNLKNKLNILLKPKAGYLIKLEKRN